MDEASTKSPLDKSHFHRFSHPGSAGETKMENSEKYPLDRKKSTSEEMIADHLDPKKYPHRQQCNRAHASLVAPTLNENKNHTQLIRPCGGLELGLQEQLAWIRFNIFNPSDGNGRREELFPA